MHKVPDTPVPCQNYLLCEEVGCNPIAASYGAHVDCTKATVVLINQAPRGAGGMLSHPPVDNNVGGVMHDSKAGAKGTVSELVILATGSNGAVCAYPLIEAFE